MARCHLNIKFFSPFLQKKDSPFLCFERIQSCHFPQQSSHTPNSMCTTNIVCVYHLFVLGWELWTFWNDGHNSRANFFLHTYSATKGRAYDVCRFIQKSVGSFFLLFLLPLQSVSPYFQWWTIRPIWKSWSSQKFLMPAKSFHSHHPITTYYYGSDGGSWTIALALNQEEKEEEEE